MAEQTPFDSAEFAENPEPRCPCVLLLDTSDSMFTVVANAGADTGQTVFKDGQLYRIVDGGTTRIDLLNQGLLVYQSELDNDPLASQRVEVSIITFGGGVKTEVPWTTANKFVPPTLTAGGDTPMGAAIIEAITAINVRKQMYKQNGIMYYRPWIFLITDGEPTDNWKSAADQVREGEQKKAFAFFAVGVDGANFNTLSQIAVRQPLPLRNCNFREMFLWLSQSQKSVSHSNVGQEHQVKLPSPSGWASI